VESPSILSISAAVILRTSAEFYVFSFEKGIARFNVIVRIPLNR
jgi:hypothetical protein